MCYGYNSAATEIRAITVSGTTPTIGAAETLPCNFYIGAIIIASSSVVRTFSADSATGSLYAKPYTVSTSTLTAGTQATYTSDSYIFRAVLNGNGNVVCNFKSSSAHRVAVFKLTSTTEAVSTASLGGTVPNSIQVTDFCHVSTGKTLFVSWDGSTAWSANILTDTAGTASVGTSLGFTNSSAVSYQTLLPAIGNTVRVANTYGITDARMTVLDCSGASPTLSTNYVYNSWSGAYAYTEPSDLYGQRRVAQLHAGSTSIILTTSNTAPNTCYMPNGFKQLDSIPLKTVSNGALGSASNESYLVMYLDTGSTGITIMRIEAAA
jgi:hypothetical protein